MRGRPEAGAGSGREVAGPPGPFRAAGRAGQRRPARRPQPVHYLGESPVRVGRFVFIGLDGAPGPIGRVCPPEEEVARRLAAAAARMGPDDQVVVVSHAPPRGCLDWAVRFSPGKEPRPIGFEALREFILKDDRVRLVVCGHAHLMGGRSERLGHALVVNVAAHDIPNQRSPAAELQLGPDAVGDPRWFWLPEGDLLRVWDIGEARARRLAEAGITDLQGLAAADPEAVAREPRRARFFVAHARALLSGKPQVLEPPNLPPPPRRYLDVETNGAAVESGFYCWLISAAEEEGPARQWVSRRGPDGEGEVLKELIGWLESAPDVPVLWYSSYERRLLKRLKALGLPAPELLRTGVDVFGECFRRYKLALPTENFDLKAAAEAAGFKFRHPELDGLAVAHRYLDWLDRGADEAELKTLLEYGEDDVLALRALTQRLDRLGCCRP